MKEDSKEKNGTPNRAHLGRIKFYEGLGFGYLNADPDSNVPPRVIIPGATFPLDRFSLEDEKAPPYSLENLPFALARKYAVLVEYLPPELRKTTYPSYASDWDEQRTSDLYRISGPNRPN